MVLDLLAFIAGVAYGYLHPGKESKKEMIKKGFRIGLFVGIFFAIVNLFLGGLFAFGATLIGTVLMIVILTLIFVGGTIIGDWLEEKLKR